MNSSIRSYIRMILLEGDPQDATQVVVQSDLTTGQWLENNGISYNGPLKNSAYFVLQDASGKQLSGSIKRKGDPFTYEMTKDRRFRVITGPNQKSIGEFVKFPIPEKDEGTAIPVDKLIKRIAKNIRLMSLYLLKSLTYMGELKIEFINTEPKRYPFSASALIKFISTNSIEHKKIINNLSELTKNKIPDYTNMNIVQPGDVIEKTKAGSSMMDDFKAASMYLTNAKKAIRTLKQQEASFSWNLVSKDAKDYFEGVLKELPNDGSFLDSEHAANYLSSNINNDDKGNYTLTLYGGTQDILWIDNVNYNLVDLRKNLKNTIGSIVSDPE